MTSEKNTTADDIVAITRAAYEAYVAKDREVVETYRAGLPLYQPT